MRTILKLEQRIGEISIPALEVDVQTFQPGLENEEWLELNNRIFAHHPDQGGWVVEDLTNRMAESWFDPKGFFIAKRDGRMIGFCWTKIHRDLARQGPVGEIYVLGVDKAHSPKGLGKALTSLGLQYFKELSINDAMLYVDADNAAALKVYRDLGFN
jgi:mycothiol synthase